MVADGIEEVTVLVGAVATVEYAGGGEWCTRPVSCCTGNDEALDARAATMTTSSLLRHSSARATLAARERVEIL